MKKGLLTLAVFICLLATPRIVHAQPTWSYTTTWTYPCCVEYGAGWYTTETKTYYVDQFNRITLVNTSYKEFNVFN